MKTKILFFAAIFALTTSIGFADVLTVSNHALGGSQYTNLQAAYDAAVNGDTLILEGTNVNYLLGYPSAIWSKSLTVIGAGFNTDKQYFKKTFISFNPNGYHFRIDGGGNGSSFYGIVFIAPVQIVATINNLTFEDCEFKQYFYTGNFATNNVTFRNSIFSKDNDFNVQLSSSSSNTILMLNCVFDGYIEGYNNSIITLIVDHCLFLSTTTAHFQGVQNAGISNCIFMNTYPGGTTGCQYINNICSVAGTLPPAGNSGSGNLENTDPNFVLYTNGELYSPTHDYQLQVGSAGIGAGVGGTDIGVHGGTSNFSEFGEPLISPVVRVVQINNTTVLPNGTLDVDITASKPADE